MSYVRDNELKDFLTLVKNSPEKIYKIMSKCNKTFYVENIDMSCMKYECEIVTNDNKLHHLFDNIKIKITADERKSHHLEYGMQCGKEIIILLPLSSIDHIIPIDTRSVCFTSEMDVYQTIIPSSEYYLIDKSISEGTIYDEHETDQAMILVSNYLEVYSSHQASWEVLSSNEHGFHLCWNDYSEYIKFYSHIIHLISNNLGKDLLDELNI